MTAPHDRLKASGCFADWQPIYAERGIPTFPVQIVDGRKKPAVRHYLRTSPSVSRDYATKFATASALGFALGRSSRITVLDVDTRDERVLADAIERHGSSPIIVRSGTGNYQVWYRHTGEGRRIRPWPDVPIDLLGAGFIVAPPSAGSVHAYEFIAGSLDDLNELPSIAGLEPALGSTPPPGAREGRRNKSLYDHCMREAHHCDDLDALIDVARTHNERSNVPPLPDDEVVQVANSAWRYTERGENRFGHTGFWSPTREVDMFVSRDVHAFALLAFLRSHNGPSRTFMVANGLSERFGWTVKRLAAARKTLVSLGFLTCTRPAAANQPALYCWGAG